MKKKLSILIHSLAAGGAERVVSILLHELNDKYHITLFLLNDTIFYDIPKNIKIVYLDNSLETESGIQKLLKLPLLAWKYKKLNDSEISLSFMYRPNYINILARMMTMVSKVIISERAMPSLQHKNGLQGFVNKILIKTLYKKADIITANSLGNSQDLKVNFDCNNIITINNPFDINKIQRLKQENIEFRDEQFTFITVGRLDSGKNHKLLIEAMKSIDAKLYVIGDGKLRKEIEKQIIDNNLQNNIILLGMQQNPYKYLAQADCFVFSSLNEGFPNVLVEALACGLPIISTDCESGPREILAPSSNMNFKLQNGVEICTYGVLTPINRIDNLTQAMNLLINDQELRNSYKEKAIQRAMEFNASIIIKQIIHTIENA